MLKVHGAVAQLQVVLVVHPGSRSTSSTMKQPNPEVVFLAGASRSSCDLAVYGHVKVLEPRLQVGFRKNRRHIFLNIIFL